MEQTRICFDHEKMQHYIDTTIWQPELADSPEFPWAVHISGWIESGIDISIHHESFKNGRMDFSNCKFHDAREFSAFVAKMLRLCRDTFKKPVRINGNDCLELMSGYRKGIDNAKHHYIDCRSN